MGSSLVWYLVDVYVRIHFWYFDSCVFWLGVLDLRDTIKFALGTAFNALLFLNGNDMGYCPNPLIFRKLSQKSCIE